MSVKEKYEKIFPKRGPKAGRPCLVGGLRRLHGQGTVETGLEERRQLLLRGKGTRVEVEDEEDTAG